MESRIYNVNLQSGYNTLTYIGISQYDAGVPLQFNVYDGATAASFPAGTTAKIQGVRPSGVGFNIACTLTDNVVTVDSSTDMTGEAGKFPVEIRFEYSGVDVGTVNFTFLIEKAPHPDGTIDADITRQETFIERLEAVENDKVPYPVTDKYGTAGQVLKTLGDGTTEWTNASSGQGVSDALKVALLQLADKVAYIDEDGQDYYNDLYEALYPPAGLTSITAVYTQGGTVYDTDELDSLKADLVVTAHYDDSSSEVVTTYTLSGTLTEGTSTITVAYGGKTTTFTVTVTHNLYWAVIPISEWVESAAPNSSYNNNLGGYYASNSSRCCLFLTDYVLEAGYKYTFEHDGTSYDFGGNRWDANCLTAVANHTSIESYSHSDSGWMQSGTSYTPDIDRVCHIQWKVTKATLISNGVTEFRIIKEEV